MKKVLLACLGVAVLCFMVTDAAAVKNANGKWALHDAGMHDAKANTCAKVFTDCNLDINTNGATGPTRHDIYIVAIDVVGIAGSRYGLCCDGPVYFYGWTKCTDFEIPTPGWPGCGQDNAQTWSVERPGPNVVLGILDAYIYPSTVSMSICVDSRVGKAEWCDANQPSPICVDATDPAYFGSVGFNGNSGYNPCNIVPVEQRSWGSVKSLYR